MWRLLKNRRVWVIVLIVAALLAIALWPRAVEVDAAAVTRGPLMVTVDEEGETRVRERFEITAPVTGDLGRIELEPGDRVQRGKTVLAVLRPAPPTPLDARARAEAVAAVDSAHATIGRLTADRDRAAATFARVKQVVDRLRPLYAQGAIPRDELDAHETELRQTEDALRAAEFDVVRARHERDVARARLIQSKGPAGRVVTIVSPIDGVVLKRHRESEAVVPAGERLLEIGDRAQLEIVSDLLSAEAVKVKAGQPVLIEQWGGGEALRGRVRRVEPSGFMKVSALGVEEQRVNVLVDFEDVDAGWRELGDGFRVEIRVVVWQDPRVLKVPTGSLFRRGDAWALFAIEEGRARLRTVQVGQQSGADVQVTGGVREGESIVLYPPDSLEDGARVQVRTVNSR